MRNTIQFQTLDSRLLSTQVRPGQRPVRGARLADKQMKPANAVGMTASVGMCAALTNLCDMVAESGSAPLRVRSARASQGDSARLHRRWKEWVDAGRPQPGDRLWQRAMLTTYQPEWGTSHAHWGGEVDIDVDDLAMKDEQGEPMHPANALVELWDMAMACGLMPVLSVPQYQHRDAGRFVRLGALHGVMDRFAEHGDPNPYGQAAMVGCVLSGAAMGLSQWAYLQARLHVGGVYAGPVTGKLNRATRAAMDALDLDFKGGTPVSTYITALDSVAFGHHEIAAL